MMNHTPAAVVRACLQAYIDKDRTAIEKLLDRDYHLRAPSTTRALAGP